MRSEVMNFFKLKQTFEHLGYFETPENTQLIENLKQDIHQGGLIIVSGIVGSGKTTLLVHVQKELQLAGQVIVSRSLSVDKEKISLGTLMTALFYDLSTKSGVKLPTQPEKRERQLLALIKKSRKPIALFVDDAHSLQTKTLVGLKRLIELVYQDGNILSVVLAGHPKLKNDLKRPVLEEIGARIRSALMLEGIKNYQQDYIKWALTEATQKEVDWQELITEEALNFLAEKLATPLQVKQYLKQAFEQAYEVGQKLITIDVVETVLVKSLNDLEPQLVRYGYSVKILSQLLQVKPGEVRSFLNGQLSANQTQEMMDKILMAGIPLSS
ncbi:MAG: AAA family ATPase [Okeania sp. SIO2F4]|nr:AAA family ATPase [Okeania sp. SIO2F4]